MSFVENLITQGRLEGMEKGLLIGKINNWEEILGKAQSSQEALKALSHGELEQLHEALRADYRAWLNER